jgi:transposase
VARGSGDLSTEIISKVLDFLMGGYIYGIEGFWSYAKERLLKFHGVSRKMFG